MPYITLSNSKKILHHINMDEIRPRDLNDLYKKRLWLLSNKEQLWLSAAKKLFERPEEFISSMYIKQKPIDTKRYVYEGFLPAYHDDEKCERLISTYDNFEIPEEIRAKGDKEIERFRTWFKENKELYEKDEGGFLSKLESNFLLRNPPTKV